jgi:copper(I)-binding protein
MRKLALALLLTVSTGIAIAHDYKAGSLTIEHPYTTATPGSNAAAYLTVRNDGAEADRLIGAKGDLAASVELHTSSDASGAMQMRQVEAIDIPAGQSVSLKPGGDHIMLIGLTAKLTENGMVPLTLVFEKAGEVQVELDIEAAGKDHHGGGHDHHSGH